MIYRQYQCGEWIHYIGITSVGWPPCPSTTYRQPAAPGERTTMEKIEISQRVETFQSDRRNLLYAIFSEIQIKNLNILENLVYFLKYLKKKVFSKKSKEEKVLYRYMRDYKMS